jgi:hypothetical protein
MFIERRFNRVVERIMLVMEDWISAHSVVRSHQVTLGRHKGLRSKGKNAP